jgi:hypothetical protein
MDSPAFIVVRARPLCTVGGKPPGTHRVGEYYSVEELGFQLLSLGYYRVL